MKHQIRRITALLMVLLLQLFLFASASAATVTRNDLQLDFSTDKDSYSVGDSIQCTVDLTNNGQQELTVSYDIVLPEGLEQVTTERSALVVGSEEQLSSSFALLAVGKGADGVPSTGDSFPLAMAGVLFVAAGVACFVLAKNKKRFAAFMMVFMLTFGMVSPMLETSAVAEDVTSGYEEDAFQTVYTEEISEEDYELQLDKAEQRALAAQGDEFVAAGELVDEFSLTHNIYVDGQLAAIRVNVVVTNAAEDISADAKATLGTVSLNPITILGRTKFFLKWKAVPGATHYEVWHLYNGSYIKKTTTTGLDYTTSYGNAGVINTYKVRAIKKSGSTIIAKGAYATRTCYGMDKPTLTSVGHTSSSSANVRIRWTAGSFCTGYHVYRSLSGATGTYTRIGSSTGLSFVDYYRNGYYKIRPYYIGKNGIEYMGPATAYKAMAPQYRALIVGQPYASWSSNRLPGCLNDAQSMKDMLNNSSNPNYRPFDVKLRTDLSGTQILNEIKTSFQRAKNNDVSLFYYSGHGTSSGWMCGINSDDTYDYVTVDELRKALDAVPGKKIVVMDCCYSGHYINKDLGNGVTLVYNKETADAFNNSIIKAFSASDKANLATSGYYVLTASSKYQTSTELSDGYSRFGAFTYVMLWGSGYNERTNAFLSTKEGDKNGDGKMTLNELYNFSYSAVNSLGNDIGFTQSVQVYPTGSSFVCWGN